MKNLDDKDFINKGDRYDNTPLHISCQKGFINCVRVRYVAWLCQGAFCRLAVSGCVVPLSCVNCMSIMQMTLCM